MLKIANPTLKCQVPYIRIRSTAQVIMEEVKEVREAVYIQLDRACCHQIFQDLIRCLRPLTIEVVKVIELPLAIRRCSRSSLSLSH